MHGRERYLKDLFSRYLPFWEAHGIDREHGGFFHSLGYDGALLAGEKFIWFQGRGLWTWSFLYNHFGRDPRHLETAARAKDFLLRFAPQPDGWWAERFARDGRVLQPFRGDLYGMYFGAEGLFEFAAAAGDEQARDAAFHLMRRLGRHVESGGGWPLGLWMVTLRVATQALRRWRDPGLEAAADRAIEMLERHYNPETGLYCERLEVPTLCVLGHAIEALWMLMDESERRGDSGLWNTCADRLQRHLDTGWDRVHGGLAHAVNVGHAEHEWPAERPVGTAFEFRPRGEYHYMKSLWSLNEVAIAALMVAGRSRAEWAARYFDLAQETIDSKFRAGSAYMLFTGRELTFQPGGDRQDNYHPPRQMMLCAGILDPRDGAHLQWAPVMRQSRKLSMRVRILYHDHCFDGAAAAAFFSRFLEGAFHPGAQFAFTGLAHKASQLFDDDMFDGDVNAIVDFKYSSHPRLTWWFDHHQSAFLTPEDAEHYAREKSEKKQYDPNFRSCTGFIARIAKEQFGYQAPDLAELVEWADIIDGAQYPDARTAVEMPAPAMKLTLVIEGAKGSETVQQIIRWMRCRKLAEIIREPQIEQAFQPLYERHLKSIEIIRSRSCSRNGVVHFDLIGYELEGYNKFIPYYLFPESVYTVSVSISSFRTKVSVGSNPWAPKPPDHNLATICERYGGGGHARVGAISFEKGQVEAARKVAAEIVGELSRE